MRNWQHLGAELKHLRDVLHPPFLQKLEGEAQFWRMSNGVVVSR